MKWALKAAIVLEAVVLALHSQHEMSKRSFASMTWMLVHLAAASMIGLLPFWANF